MSPQSGRAVNVRGRIDVVLEHMPGARDPIFARAIAGQYGFGGPRAHRPCADPEEHEPGFGDHAALDAYAGRETCEREVAMATRQLLEPGPPASGRARHRQVSHDLAGLERARVDTPEK